MDNEELLQYIKQAAADQAERLDLSGLLHIEILPPEIGQLSNLKELYLSNIHLSKLPPEIYKLSKLEILDIGFNQLKKLNPEIGQLTNLRKLFLNDNRLTNLPPEIGKLSKLEVLSLRHNYLSQIPIELGNLSNLRTLYLANNLNLVDPPPEILSKGTEVVVDYFRQKLEQGQDSLYEAKLLIVGEGEAGKTSLAKKIEDEGYYLDRNEASTEGIDVIRWGVFQKAGR